MTLQEFLKKETLYSLIDGNEVAGLNQTAIEFISPTIESAWKNIVPVGTEEVKLAINTAQSTYSKWRKTPAPIRAKHLRKVASLIVDNKELLAEVMTMEMGKPIKESLAEIDYSAGFFTWFAGEAERIYGTTIPSQYPNKSLKVIHEPIGVCGIITPWNFPLAMPARKVAPALAAGCTVVAKPSPESPISMLLLAKICEMAGIPSGAFNVVIGAEQEVGSVILESQAVRKISFTGSTKVGKYLYRESSNTMKKITMELGGHAPLIIYDDADIDIAIAGTIASKFRNTGQTCVCANKILVQDSIYDLYCEKLMHAVKNLKIGDPRDPDTEISKVLHPISTLKVQEHVEDALSKGAKALHMTEKPYEPKILTGISPAMKIFREETFGPVAPIIRFAEDDEGITLANASEFGLAAYIFTTSMKRANKSVSELEYGVIGVNDGVPSTPQGSFGGMKNSGLGREGGPTGIYEYMTEKYVSIAFS
ncbi:MAG: NAD-dependent succinate-semialdehyde dehydrogenase [Chlamydiota bacterium]|nr:NAD-dependent succinate-semialdehyde dehydrogenase [Chlamydiota bacterium]